MESCPDPFLLGPQVGELFEGPLQTPVMYTASILTGSIPTTLAAWAVSRRIKTNVPGGTPIWR